MKAFYEALVGDRGLKIKRSFDSKAYSSAKGTEPLANAAVVADPITTLYGSVRHLLDDQEQGVVLHIVAATAGEGVTTIAQGLARRAATAGHRRVLLIDGQHRVSALPSKPPGLIDAVIQGRPLADVAGQVADTSLYAADLFGIDRSNLIDVRDVRAVYAECRKEFELTIVDCPPISGGHYFDLVPKNVDGVIFVVQAEKLRPVVIQHTKNALEQQGGKIFGVVLNKTTRYIPNIVYKMI